MTDGRIQVRLLGTCRVCKAVPIEILLHVVGMTSDEIDRAVADAYETAQPCNGCKGPPLSVGLSDLLREGRHLEAQAELENLHARDPRLFAATLPRVWEALDAYAATSAYSSPRVVRFVWSSFAARMAVSLPPLRGAA